MAEPLYDDALVVRHDVTLGDGLVDVVGAMAGPAGVSAVELADGVVWEVDHARPGQLVQLTLARAQLTSSGSAAALLGNGRVDAIARWVDSASALPLRLPRDPDGPNHFAGSVPRGGIDAVRAGLLVVAFDLLDDPSIEPLARVAAGGVWLARIGQHDLASLASLGAPVADTVASLAEDVTDDELAVLVFRDPGSARQLQRLLDDGDTGDMPARHACRQLAWRLGSWLRRAETEADAVVAAPHQDRDDVFFADVFDADVFVAGSAPSTVHMELDVSRSLQEDRFDPHFRQVRMVAPGVLRVEVARADVDRWVRVRRRGELLTVSLAPLRRDGLLEGAELVVPPDLDVGCLDVDIVARAELDAGPRGAEVIRDAIRVGRRAAHLDRLGLRDRARGEWLRCGDLWSDAGDGTRAKLAFTYAGGASDRFGPTAGDALLADLVIEALAAG